MSAESPTERRQIHEDQLEIGPEVQEDSNAPADVDRPSRHVHEGITRGDRVGTLLISSAVIAAAAYVLVESLGYKPGTGGDPGAAALPRLVAVLSIAAALILIIQSLRKPMASKTPVEKKSPKAAWRVGLMALTMGVGTILLPMLGYFVVMSILLYAAGLLAGSQKWWVNLLIAFIGSWVTLLVFGGLFSVPLPMGPIDRLLGG